MVKNQQSDATFREIRADLDDSIYHLEKQKRNLLALKETLKKESFNELVIGALAGVYSILSITLVYQKGEFKILQHVLSTLDELAKKKDTQALRSEISDLRTNAITSLMDIKKKLEDSKKEIKEMPGVG